MAKTRSQKELTLKELVDSLKRSKSVVFADFRNLTVGDATALRRKARKDNVGIVVAKKTLMRLAFKEAGFEGIDPSVMEGAVLLALGYDDEVAPARVAAEFGKDHESLKIVAGVLERKLVTAAAIKELAKLPSKSQLIAQVVGSIKAPLTGLVNVLQGNLRGLVTVIGAIKDQKSAA
jgi:large subunit ribosomal protein L10